MAFSLGVSVHIPFLLEEKGPVRFRRENLFKPQPVTKTQQEIAHELLTSRPTTTEFKEWEQYSHQEKRLAIAFDVIQAVLAGVYVPSMEYYFDYERVNDVANTTSEYRVQTLLQEESLMDLKVDAIGAAFLSLVRFENNYLAGELGGSSLCFSHEPNRKRLIDIFGDDELCFIESSFGGCDISETPDSDQSPEYREKMTLSVRFGTKCRDGIVIREYADYEAMLAIWNNIIINGGTFNPENAYDDKQTTEESSD